MNLELLRVSSQEDSTLGVLYERTPDRKFLCFTIEDEYRSAKVPGETRIPKGYYEVKLRKHGGFHQRYSERFPFHEGMLELQNVPNFTDVLIHCGNTDDDTAGCLLLGDNAFQNVTTQGKITGSVNAYKRLYPGFAASEDLWIEIRDYD